MTSSYENQDSFIKKWGLSSYEVFKIALKFYKEKDGSKALTINYADRLKLMALSKQAIHGEYDQSNCPESGFFDVVGNSRKQAWQALGNMSKDVAMIQFIELLIKLCPLFDSVILAHRVEREEAEKKKRQEQEEIQKLLQQKQEEEMKKQEDMMLKQQTQELMIRAVLNQQTSLQFRQFAQLQYPNNVQQQDILIAQLQEQHFAQYIQQAYNKQLMSNGLLPQNAQQVPQMQSGLSSGSYNNFPMHPQNKIDDTEASPTNQCGTSQQLLTNLNSVMPVSQIIPSPTQTQNKTENALVAAPIIQNGTSSIPSAITDTESSISNQVDQILPNLLTSNLSLTQINQLNNFNSGPSVIALPNGKQLTGVGGVGGMYADDFKNNEQQGKWEIEEAQLWTRNDVKLFKDSLKDETESIIKISSGEFVKIKVPTHHEGTCLFWEFATDSYDISFGITFSFASPSDRINQIGKESVHGVVPKINLEIGEGIDDEDTSNSASSNGHSIVPTIRRQSHQEVYCGSHSYPGKGIYTLIFDNSYSLFRSKVIYYRVYYSQ